MFKVLRSKNVSFGAKDSCFTFEPDGWFYGSYRNVMHNETVFGDLWGMFLGHWVLHWRQLSVVLWDCILNELVFPRQLPPVLVMSRFELRETCMVPRW